MVGFKIPNILLLCLIYFVFVKAEHCIPGIVPNITITSDREIEWSPTVNPALCNISEYVIDIFDSEDGTQLQFQTGSDKLTYDISFLDMCKSYSFEVHALTDQKVLGPSERINETIPAAENMNLTLNIKEPILLNYHEMDLAWDPISTEVIRCISYYRVVYWDENNSPKDVYVPTNKFNLSENLVPCMAYSFQVNAIVTNPDTEGPLTEIDWSGYTVVPNPPKLVNMVTSTTTVNMTWKVPTYAENRCKLTSLLIDTLGLPTNTSTTIVTIQDSDLRPDVNINLEDLTPNTVYTSHVSLQNSAGYSKNVTVTFQTSDTFVFNYERDVTYN